MATSCEHLITLVGSNPLPAYLSVRALRPEKVTLVYSPQTNEPRKRLASVLAQELGLYPADRLDCQQIDDAANEIEIRDKLTAVLGRDRYASLDYTGGTKVMSTGARLALNDKAHDDREQGFYWDGGKGLMRFCSGGSKAARDLIPEGVTLRSILALHGAELGDKRPIPATANSVAEAKARLAGNASGGDGHWLEHLTAALVRDLTSGVVPADIYLRARVKRPGERGKDTITGAPGAAAPEFDVIATVEQRLHLIECGAGRDDLTDKLFAVSQRSRQLGGDLARAALITCRPSMYPGDKAPAVDTLSAMANDHWESPNPVKVFGIDDLRAWINDIDNPPMNASHALSGLRKWLELP